MYCCSIDYINLYEQSKYETWQYYTEVTVMDIHTHVS